MREDTSQQLDVIVTAGDRGASRAVLQKNKAFLPIAGVPVINYVLSAVERAWCTARIFVVGNKTRLEETLALPNNPFQGNRPVVLVEQGDTLYDNVWKAFLHTLPGYTPGMDWHCYADTAAADKAILFIAGDIPLATPMEIDAFVDGCDLSRYDYFLGLTAEPDLRYYYPQDGRPGVQMAYFTLRDLQVRHNNLHLVKPLRLGNREYIQRIYDLRYQKEWRNIAGLCWELAKSREVSPRLIWSFLFLHMARFITRRGWQRALPFRPFFLELPMVSSLMSQVLRTRFTTTMTHYGGCTMDVDNAEHYEAICTNHERWLTYQSALAKELKQQS